MKKNNQEFSKRLLVQESVLLWIVTIAFLILAFVCVIKQYFGELPWLTAMAAFPWTTYGVSQAFYYEKAKKENMKDGIKYDSVMYDLMNKKDEEDTSERLEFTGDEDEIAVGLGLKN